MSKPLKDWKTVAQFINELSELPQDALVVTPDLYSKMGEDYDGYPDWYEEVEVDYSPACTAVPTTAFSYSRDRDNPPYVDLDYSTNSKGRPVVVLR